MPKKSHWLFPHHKPSIANQGTTTVNRLPQNVQALSAPSTANVQLRLYQNSTLLIDMQWQSGIQQENPIRTAKNVVPGLANPVFQPACPYVGPTPLSGPQLSAPAPQIPDND